MGEGKDAWESMIPRLHEGQRKISSYLDVARDLVGLVEADPQSIVGEMVDLRRPG